MSLQVVSNSNIAPTKMVPVNPANPVSNGSAFKVYDEQQKASNKVKVGVFLTTLAGVTLAMARTLKVKKIPFKNPKEFIYNLIKIKYEKDNELPWLVTRLAIGSVGGGLIGGALFDKKENMKAKIRESIIQLVGNIATPLSCVIGGEMLFKKFAEPKLIEKFGEGSKLVKAPKILSALSCLAVGIISGNKIGNYINKTLFNCDEKRTLKLTDMSPHIDDIATSATFVIPGDNPVGMFLKRIIPAALMISGFSTGIAQEHHTKLHYHPDEKSSSN